jgi:methylmalonyl-CoA mutase
MYSAKEILSEFESLDSADWLKGIEKYLKGKSFEDLVLKLEGGAEIKPFYRKEDVKAFHLPVLNSNDWLIGESFAYNGADKVSFNRELLNALMNGTESVNLQLEAGNPAQLSDLLENVYLNMIDLNLSAVPSKQTSADWLSELAILSEGKVKGFVKTNDNNESITLLRAFSDKLPNYSFFNFELKIDQGIIPNLSILLKEISLAFELMLQNGISAERAQAQINIHTNLSEDYFLSIASIRALKRLWLGLIEAYGVEQPLYPKIHCITTQSVTSADPYWNMISNTTEALSAAIAQVYSLEVRSTDNSAEKAAFSRRIARNVQHLLKMESHIDHIVDPAAGSYYIEHYSTELARCAWDTFSK